MKPAHFGLLEVIFISGMCAWILGSALFTGGIRVKWVTYRPKTDPIMFWLLVAGASALLAYVLMNTLPITVAGLRAN